MNIAVTGTMRHPCPLLMNSLAPFSCPDDIAEPLRLLLRESTFELRALEDLRRSLTHRDDRQAAAKVAFTHATLTNHVHHLPPLLMGGDQVAFCCILDWYWDCERPVFREALYRDALLTLAFHAADYELVWQQLDGPVRRELTAYATLPRRAVG